MLSKRNYKLKNQKASPKQQHFTIKKFTVGVASVLVGTTFGVVIINKQALADELEGPAIETIENEPTLQQDSVMLKANSSENELEQATNASASPQADIDFEASETITSTQQTSPIEPTGPASEELVDERSATTENTVTSESKETEMTSEVATSVIPEEKQVETVTPETVASTNDQTPHEENTPVETTFSTRAVTLADENNTETTVNSWSGLIGALNNSQYQTITVNGQINASGTSQIFGNGRTVVIKGSDQNAGILFGSTPLVANGTWNITFENLKLTTLNSAGVVDFNTPSTANTVTFKDVRHSGASLYGGDGSASVVIAGTTTSTVSLASVPTVETYKANGNDANIWGARSVTIADGANFTLARAAIGDGINLPDGATVLVGDKATFTLNMNTNNATDRSRYHDAGIFMLNGGSFLTGRNAKVTLNTSIGQAVSIGANRPGLDVTDTDRFGGYTANQSRNNGPTTVTLGEYSTLDFTGRDGFILGNNANFTSGEYSNVHFQNNGRGVALDLANNSNIYISKHSNTLFESRGKTGNAPSGSYDGYNYIGVNEGGNITIDEYATFRVILSGRGSNEWDDVISLDSRLATSTASFTSKKGAIVDIRDDNTNFYAELISFPLSVSGTKATINIEDPLYLNLQRYSAGGPTTGWMPVGGTAINSTSDEYTANLIYIGGNTGKVVIGGTDYVVYQQIKSDGTQQIWLNINEVTLNKNGFSSLDQMNNGANPDISISGTDLVSGIPADHIKDNQSSPTVGSTTPYYGISTMRASHQIWFPHSTVAELVGSHQNVIRYVYEDGSPVLDATGAPLVVTQSADLIRNLELAITAERIQDIQNYAATHTADETLKYIRDTYTISKDSGWKVTDTTNTQTTYDAVISPVLDGYIATIQQTNAGGVTVGGNADSVQANLALDPNAALSDADFKATYTSNVNGTLGIPENYETIVVYKKEVQDQTVTIIYQDKTDNNKVLATEERTGKPGESLGYSTAETIKSFTDKGYKLVSDGVPPNATFGDTPVTYYVILEHDVAPVGPNDPHDPGTPINPNDPDGPKWPSSDNYTKTYTSTIEFVDEQGNKLPNIPDNVQTSTWTRTLNVDKVTGEILNPDEAWTPDKPTYDKVNVPVVPGYYADVSEVAEKPTVPENITDRVVYRPLGKVIPVDPNGDPIPNAPTPQYPNDPSDPTKGGETPIPTVPGYHPQDPNTPTVTPTEPGKDTPVVYIKDEVAKYSLVEKFVDENGVELAPTVTKGTEYVEGEAYDVTSDAKVIAGYYLKAIPTNVTGTFGKENVTVTFVYAPLGKVIPVDPNGDPIPDAPTPQYPNDPNDPTKGGETPIPTVPGYHPQDPNTPTVTPTEPGKDTPVVYIKDEVAKYSLVEKFVDENGVELAPTVTKGTEYVEGETYDVTSDGKVISGYYLKAVPANATGTFGKENVTVTFVYAPLGKVIPVDPEGNPIPDAPTPQYPNDPNDPTKGGETPVPNIPGMTPEVPSVIPTDPGTDIKVVYVVDDQKATINYIDETKGQLITSESVTGKSKTKIDYTTANKIQELLDKGYVLVNDGFPSEAMYDDDKNIDQFYTVILKHGIAPVGPNDPHDPGTPINPNDPDGPKWPAEEQYRKEYTSTIEFVDEQGNKVAESNIQTSTWTRTLQINKVTGEILNPNEAWTADKDKYTEVTSPVIIGYYADKVKVPAKDTVQSDLIERVVYRPLGKVTPVDPEGNPIPDAPTPQYPNDPNDPTKGGETPIPVIPGYHPQDPNTPTVTPTEPGKDTPIVYIKDEEKYSLVEKFVDENGKELASSVTKGTEYVAGMTYDVTSDAKVISGYYLKMIPTNATGTFGKENVTVTFVYAPLGKVIPVDPNGDPIPNVPTPQYPNDPNDPTKGGETPVPEIPGYRPEKPTVTPDKPGENTNVIYVPIVPEKHEQKAKIIYIDEQTGMTLVTDEVKGQAETKIDYSTAKRIQSFTDKGYVVIDNGFTNAGIPYFDNDDNVDQVYVIKLGHGTAPVGPNDPHEPGTPINPNDPNGPKWPAKDGYTKQYTSTVHFVDENGNKLRDDDIQTSTWTRTLIVDKVTGKILNPNEAWRSDKNDYVEVRVPVIKGYYADRAVVPGAKTEQRDLETTVVYKKIGKIIPVDPAGVPLPNAPTPQYQNDPNDPTKVIVTNVPEVPGLTPEVLSVDPSDPGADTPVIYKRPEKQVSDLAEPKHPVETPVVTKTLISKESPVKSPTVSPVQLPQTGEKQNSSFMAALGSLFVASMLGLVGGVKKKKDDK